MPNPSTLPARHDATWAEVRAHDHVMRYRRSGAGQALLLLSPAESGDALWPELADALATGFRVIRPEIPDDGADVAAWLADFLEGLGVARVAVLACDGFCLPALELALLGADQVARLALVPGGRAGDTGLDGALAARAPGAAVPLLVARRGLPAAEALPLVRHFLAGHGADDARQGDRSPG
jgi:pimeloyl-ACP methyl ester carboxylesterase